mmetsp:Transcript_3887/g.12079  ORF Transcript_3887/g.12079 Transcript_3887/m.12079 type:complete len:193 (-) Transcript_3887:29-607(-)
MLAADKLLLEGKIAQSSVRLKWKEFKLHHMNLETVGTQAAVMAGFSVSALIKFHTHSEVDRRLLFLFYTSNMVSLSANILCVATTTMIVVFGSGLSTRGADGSMVRAVDAIYALRRYVFGLFWVGVLTLLLAAVFFVWIIFGRRRAALASTLLFATIYLLFRSKREISKMFYFERNESISFCDLQRVAGRRV